MNSNISKENFKNIQGGNAMLIEKFPAAPAFKKAHTI
jgi:hypothetical protein